MDVLFVRLRGRKCRNVSISPLMYLLFPYHADFYADRWIERDAGTLEEENFIGHAGIEKTAIFSGFTTAK